VSFNTIYWKTYFYYYILSTNYHFENLKIESALYLWISAVSYSADSESAMYPTTLIQNQRCMTQRWFGISAVSDSTDISFKGMFTLSFLLWSNEHCRIQRWFGISAVSNNPDSDLALYPQQHWFRISAVPDSTGSESVLYPTALIMNFYLWMRISPRIRIRIQKSFRVWIRGRYRVNAWKKPEVKNLMLLSL
jgi:hypothetical protein